MKRESQSVQNTRDKPPAVAPAAAAPTPDLGPEKLRGFKEGGAATGPAQAPAAKAPRARRKPGSEQYESVEVKTAFGITSRSASSYPTAYAPVDKKYRAGLTDEQQRANTIAQATAQEKVGYEKGTPKFFIKDFDGEGASGADHETRLVMLAAPRLIFGGMLIGAGIVLGTLGALGHFDSPFALVGGISGIALGITLASSIRTG